MFRVNFWVEGKPGPKGNMRAVLIGGRPRAIPAYGEAFKKWERAVKLVASRYLPDDGPLAGPVSVSIRFKLKRPKKPEHNEPIGRVGDIDKLIRATLDPLTGHLFMDDAQVVQLFASKLYSDDGVTGAEITVAEYLP